jgi:TIR domain
VPGPSLRGVFLSYRREDAAPYARLLQHELRERFPDDQVFMDLDSIEPGQDFSEVIRQAVGSSAVLVALIGRRWATITDEEGQRRLDNPDDYVRFEVATALERGVRVIPVLVDGAKPLRQQQLPAELHKLARLNVLDLSMERYQYDADRLLALIRRTLADVIELEETERRASEEAGSRRREDTEPTAPDDAGLPADSYLRSTLTSPDLLTSSGPLTSPGPSASPDLLTSSGPLTSPAPSASPDLLTSSGPLALDADNTGRPDRHRPRREIVIALMAVTVLVAGAAIAGVRLLAFRGPPSFSLQAFARSGLPQAGRNVYVRYRDVKEASARISGRINNAKNGEIARLYAQPFPYHSAPVRVGSLTLHPVGTTASYAFQVTPSLATFYTVELFKNSAAAAPLATSRATTVYVTPKVIAGSAHKCRRPVCHEVFHVRVLVPAAALVTEMAQRWYPYFGLSQAPAQQPSTPQQLVLDAGRAQMSKPRRISGDEFGFTVTFSFPVGKHAYAWNWAACTKPIEATDGIGLPGQNGCGGARIRASEPGMLPSPCTRYLACAAPAPSPGQTTAPVPTQTPSPPPTPPPTSPTPPPTSPPPPSPTSPPPTSPPPTSPPPLQ